MRSSTPEKSGDPDRELRDVWVKSAFNERITKIAAKVAVLSL